MSKRLATFLNESDDILKQAHLKMADDENLHGDLLLHASGDVIHKIFQKTMSELEPNRYVTAGHFNSRLNKLSSIARSKNTHPETLHQLMSSMYSNSVHTEASSNPNTPHEHLEKLAERPENHVYIASNPNSQTHLLDKIAKSDGGSRAYETHFYVARNRNTSKDTLKYLQQKHLDPLSNIRATVDRRLRLDESDDILKQAHQKLVGRRDRSITQELAEKSSDPETLHKIALQGDWSYKIMTNPNTSADSIHHLVMQTNNHLLAKRALQHSNVSEKTVEHIYTETGDSHTRTMAIEKLIDLRRSHR